MLTYSGVRIAAEIDLDPQSLEVAKFLLHRTYTLKAWFSIGMVRQWCKVDARTAFLATSYLASMHGLFSFEPQVDDDGDLEPLAIEQYREAFSCGNTIHPRTGRSILISDVVLGFRPTARLLALDIPRD